MLPGPLSGVDIPQGFLESYQRNFRFMVFDTADGVVREDYSARVAFRRLVLTAEVPEKKLGQVGGSPTWVLDDETPGSYRGSVGMVFLMHLMPGLRFDASPGAPRQIGLGLDGKPRAARRDGYQLFLRNAVYLFGTSSADVPLVYAITQVD